MDTKKSDSSLFLLGKYLSLVLVLPASVFAGYLVAVFLENVLHRTGLQVFGIVLGIVSGMFKIIQELLRDARRAEKQK